MLCYRTLYYIVYYKVPVPSMLCAGAVHQTLVRSKRRVKTMLVVVIRGNQLSNTCVLQMWRIM